MCGAEGLNADQTEFEMMAISFVTGLPDLGGCLGGFPNLMGSSRFNQEPSVHRIG